MSFRSLGNLEASALEVLLGQVRDAVAFVDPSGVILLTNRGKELPGPASEVSMEDVDDVFQIFRPDGRRYITPEWPVLRSVSTGEVIIDEEFFRLAPDGSRRSFSCSSAPIRDGNGHIIAAVVTSRDITEQRRSQEQLAYLLPMLDHTEDAIVANDAQWHIRAWNKGAQRMFGWTAEEAVGRPATFLRLDESDQQRLERRRQLAEYGRWRGETTVGRKDGSKVPVEVIGVATRNGNGEITGYLGIHRDITERKRTEEALGAATRRAEQILESISDVFFAVDRDWRYTYVNQRAVEQAGLEWGREVTAQELLGKSCWELFPEQLGTAYDLQLHRALREQRVVAFEVLSARTGRWAEVRAYPSEDGVSVYSRDIGERKRAEKELREANSRTENILESITDSFTALDADWRYTYLNQRALDRIEQMEGKPIPVSDLVGKTVWDAFPNVVGTTIDRELHRAVLEQRTVEFELYSHRTEEWLEVRVYPSKDGGLSVYTRDITERKRADEQLAYHASLLDNVEDGVVATGENNFCITAWNKGAERLFGFTPEEVLGRPARQVASYPGDESRFELERELTEIGRTRIAFTAHHKDGTPIEVELIAVAVKGADGEVTGYLGICRDITERKRSENKLREAHRQIETILESITESFGALDAHWRYTYMNRHALERAGNARGEPILLADVVGRRIWDVFPELVGTTIDHEYHRAVREQKAVVFETYSPLIHEWVEVHAYPSQDGGLSIYARDVNERKRASEELERRISQQAAVAELGLSALEDGGLQGLMDEASTLVCRGLGVDYGKVDELLADGTGLLVRAGAGWPEGVVGSVVMPTGRRSPAGYALLISQPVIVDDLSAETRFEVPAVLREHAVMSDITVPIETGGRQYGTLAALSKNRRTFSEHDISFVQSLANILASAAVRAESEQRLEAAREGERSRIARDLHDGALSELTDALALATFARSDPTKERTEAIITSLQGVAHQLRAAAYDLRLPAEEERDFSDRLEELVAVQAGMATDREVSLRGGERLPSGSLGTYGTGVLRIVREAITNARRHSSATTIRLDAGRSTPDALRLEISDDGAWADRERVVSTRSGTGIRGMFERGEEVGAALKIEGRPGGGTTLSLELPLDTKAGATQ